LNGVVFYGKQEVVKNKQLYTSRPSRKHRHLFMEGQSENSQSSYYEIIRYVSVSKSEAQTQIAPRAKWGLTK